MKHLALMLLSAAASCSQSSPPPAPPAPHADRIEVLARHLPAAGEEDLASDPVVIHFDKFAVTQAHFDPRHLEGGTATIVLDITSIKTGSAERDDDLESPDYLDAAQFATATIQVTGVEQASDARYTADAAVAFRGITMHYPVTFEVLATTADTIRVKGEQAFSRLDFNVGIDPATDPTERIAAPLVLQFDLMLQTS